MKRKLLTVALAGIIPMSFCHKLAAETTFSGEVEVEAFFTDEEDDVEITVEFAIDHKINDKVDAHVLFEIEENEEEVELSEVVINLHPNKNIDIAVGRLYVPFGRYDTNIISDPLTEEFAETREEALLVTSKFQGFEASAYVFKDDAEGANESIDNYGINLSYENDNFSIGAGYLSDVLDSTTEGVNVNGSVTFGDFSFFAEYIRLDDINGVNPDATHLELIYKIKEGHLIAASYQETSDALDEDLPEEVFGIAYTIPVYKNTSFSAEYLNTTDIDDNDDDVFTIRLAVEF